MWCAAGAQNIVLAVASEEGTAHSPKHISLIFPVGNGGDDDRIVPMVADRIQPWWHKQALYMPVMNL